MSYAYAERKRTESGGRRMDTSRKPAAPSRSMEALPSVTAEPIGRRIDLPEATRAKMEASFGADFSGVRLYESQKVADAGANAIAQGSSIAFAPGKADFSGPGGQALLGHELSHVMSQARGQVRGSGFLNDRALEAQADREGALAAAGKPVYTGPVTAPLSAASAAPAAGPMQADRKGQPEAEQSDSEEDYGGPAHPLTPDDTNKRTSWWDWRKAHSSWRKSQDKHNKLTAKTGLGEKKADVKSRMAADMADMMVFRDDEYGSADAFDDFDSEANAYALSKLKQRDINTRTDAPATAMIELADISKKKKDEE